MVHISRINLWCIATFNNVPRTVLFYKVIVFALLMHTPLVLGSDEDVKKVHFKIHVPEFINHHVHTKIMFIHEDHGKEHLEHHAPQYHAHHPYDEETYLEDYSSWNNNGQVAGHHRSKLHQHKYINGYEQPPVKNGVYMTDGQGEDIVGFTYPPQYANEMPHNNIETYSEDGYRQGLHSESGHLVTNNQDNYYDVNQDEADMTDHDYYHEEHDNRDLHSHHRHYDKEIGHQDRVGRHANHRKYLVMRMIPR